jgi:ABC-2 type transport system permease protein
MIRLLKIEWLKIKNYTAFIIVSIFFVIGVVAVNYIIFVVNNNMISQSQAVILTGKFSPFQFDKTWQTTSYAAGWLLLLPALMLIILITNEFTFRTHRQNIIDGWSRLQFIHVKIVMALLVAIFSTILVFFTALAFGFSSGTAFSTHGIAHVGFFFLKALSYNMIALLIGVLIRRTGFAIGVFFIYMGVENFISQLLDVWSVSLRKHNNLDLGSMGDYLPMNSADGMLTFPSNPLKLMAKGVLPTDYPWLVLSLCIAYLLLFYWATVNRMLKTDL